MDRSFQAVEGCGVTARNGRIWTKNGIYGADEISVRRRGLRCIAYANSPHVSIYLAHRGMAKYNRSGLDDQRTTLLLQYQNSSDKPCLVRSLLDIGSRIGPSHCQPCICIWAYLHPIKLPPRDSDRPRNQSTSYSRVLPPAGTPVHLLFGPSSYKHALRL